MARIHIKDLSQISALRDPTLAWGGAAPRFGSIAVTDSSGTLRTSSSVGLVLSFGLSGHGAFPGSGQRIDSPSTNCDTLLNAHSDVNGTAASFNDVFTLQTPSTK